jgi:hypothetical protein
MLASMSGERKDWLYGEPTIEEMLSDPPIIAVMKRYGVTAEQVRALLAPSRPYAQAPFQEEKVRPQDGDAR